MPNDNYDDTCAALEALLFVSDEPVSTAKLADLTGIDADELEGALQHLSRSYEEKNRGIQLRQVAGGWRLYSHPAFHELIEKYILSWDTRKLSAAALETLAVIAYHQPVTRTHINAIRGVNCEGVVSSLVEKGLVRQLGREKAAGHALLYGTTHSFLEKFGLKDIKELPPLEDFAPDEKTKEFIAQRLNSKMKTQFDVETEDIGNDSEENEALF